MNRQQRRSAERKGVTAQDLKVISDQSKSAGINAAVQGILASLIFTLHDKWGWGNVRCARLIEQINDQFDAINSDHVTIEDMLKVIKDEIGVTIK